MKITFLYSGGESLGIELLSSVLKREGFSTSLVFSAGLFDDKQYLDIPFLRKAFNHPRQLVEAVIREKPDLVCFSVVTDMYEWAGQVAGEIKKSLAVPIIFGGIHASSIPEEVIKKEFVDMVCLGEGEAALLELVRSMEKKEKRSDIKNIWFKAGGRIIRNTVRPLLENLDALPFPDKELFSEAINLKNGRYMIMTGRGCPYSCTYCYNDVYRKLYSRETNLLRQRSVTNVIAELRLMKEKYAIRSVEFMDDLFAANTAWLKEFALGYVQEIRLPYQCMADTNVINAEKADLLKSSGCTRIKFGVQTINPQTRQKILNRYFERQEQIERALKLCDSAGLDYSLDHIFGIPGETETDYRDTALFYSQTMAKRVNCYSIAYFPNTKISEIALAAGRLTKGELDLINLGKQSLYVSGSFLKDKELKLYKCYRSYYALLPVLNRKVLSKILNSRAFYLLRFIPQPVLLVLEFFTALKTGHLRGLDFVRYYKRHIFGRPVACYR
ncbi:MAG: radical SAM protein [Candidatus Omnitrophota bacterium]|nr:radical SAM protein [Candidatus Omnitrophota bacterium]